MAFQYGLSGPGVLNAPMFDTVLIYLSGMPARIEDFKANYFRSNNPEEFAKQYLSNIFAEVNATGGLSDTVGGDGGGASSVLAQPDGGGGGGASSVLAQPYGGGGGGASSVLAQPYDGGGGGGASSVLAQPYGGGGGGASSVLAQPYGGGGGGGGASAANRRPVGSILIHPNSGVAGPAAANIGLTNAQLRRVERSFKQGTRFGSVNSRNALTYNRRTPAWLHFHNARYPAGRKLWTPSLAENVPPQVLTSEAARNQATALRQELYPHVIHNPENEERQRKRRRTQRKRKNQKTRKNRKH